MIASWNHRVKFRNWIDFDVYNTLDMYFGLTNQGGINLLKSAYGRNKDIKVEKKLCDYFLEDGTFVKIDAINLGYTLPLSGKTNSFIKSLRVYANINNLCTITGYKVSSGGIRASIPAPALIYSVFNLHSKLRQYYESYKKHITRIVALGRGLRSRDGM